jgi:2-polyprenyl-3-methyl-5-hydroxy-6-metoxy-1,4-benzoquinol methylase
MNNISNNYIQTDSLYHTNNPNWENYPGSGIEGGINMAHDIITILKKNNILDKIGGDSIGDIGCGAGHVLNSLANLLPDTFQYYGYDISSTAISLAKKYERNRLQFFCQDLFNTDIKKFDVLISIYVVEHIPNYYDFLTQCKKRAEYNIIVFPINMNVINVMFKRECLEYEKAGHLHFFSEFTATQSMRDCSYEIIDYIFIGNRKIKTVMNNRISWKKRLMTIPRVITCNLLSPSLSLRYFGGGGIMILAR